MKKLLFKSQSRVLARVISRSGRTGRWRRAGWPKFFLEAVDERLEGGFIKSQSSMLAWAMSRVAGHCLIPDDTPCLESARPCRRPDLTLHSPVHSLP